MSTPNQNEILEMCARAGIDISDSALNIGRELSYRGSPLRTVVIRFIESDFPNTVKESLAAILQLDTSWVLFCRYGELRAKEFVKSDIPQILEYLVERYPTVDREGDDIYLLAKSGKLYISFDHDLLGSGLPVSLADIPLAGMLLAQLNELGAEVELFSQNG
jgi:hypothetical protein